MQAHPQSTPAALIPSQPSLSSKTTASSRYSPPSHPPPPATAPTIAQAAGLAHDAGNLLGALGLYCDLLRVPGVLQREHRHYATELGLISSRSSDLIRRLLDLSTQNGVSTHSSLPSHPAPTRPAPASDPDAGPYPGAFRLQPSDVRRNSLQSSETLRPGLTHTSVLRHLAPVLQRIAAGVAAVSVVAPALLPPLDLPIEALERITVNLVRNAVEAIRRQQEHRPAGTPRSHGEIRVSLTILAGRLQLAVEDNGPGVPAPIIAAFLNPGPLPSNSGRGLGHRIVHDLVTSTGGQISIRTRPGHGTAFCLKWPMPSLHAATPASVHASALHLTAAAAPKGVASC